MSHRERDIVPDGGTSETKGALSLKFLASVWNTKYAIVSREAESAWWDVEFKVRTVRRSSASDRTVLVCSSLVFCSAFYWKPVQIHKGGEGGGGIMFAGKTSRTIHSKCTDIETAFHGLDQTNWLC